MAMRIPIGVSDFKKLREQGLVYVDKSHLIREILDKGAQTILLPRPRRFGKTLNLSMLRSFFEKREEDLSGRFAGLSIMDAGEAYRAHFQRYLATLEPAYEVRSARTRGRHRRMGSTIRQTAAVADIHKDVDTTYTNAAARGGVALSLADQSIGPVLKIAATVATQITAVNEGAKPLLAALDAANDHADDLFNKVSDDIWNAVGRPATDPYLSVILPGGSAFYVDGDVTEQPDKMLLFVELLRAGIHPKLPKADADKAADSVEAEGAVLRAAVDAAQGPRTKLQLLERVYTALARIGALQLAAYKRLLKANGFSESDAHAIIPDRPRAEPKGKGEPGDK